MSEHKGLPVAGYKDQSDRNIQIVNINKVLEERILRTLDNLANMQGVDGRMIALGRTNIQQAFMWINRAVFQPARIDLPEDTDD